MKGQKMVEILLQKEQHALFCEMGTGKTKPIIDLFYILKDQGKIKRCLVICPKSLLDNLGEEIYDCLECGRMIESKLEVANG